MKRKWHLFVWVDNDTPRPFWQRELIRLLRILSLVGRDVAGGQLTLRAMSLVYTTLLSLVPLLAVSFSVLKGFGVHNQIEPMLLNMLEPLGEKSVEVTGRIVGFVDNMKIGVLGFLGIVMLLFTVMSLIQKIEAAFNFTWRLSASRNLSQRFSNYLSVVMVGPVLVFSAVGITASLKSHTIVSAIESLPYFGHVMYVIGLLVPYLMIIGAFTFVYILVPNTRVNIRSALYGALIAGLLWRLSGNLFAAFAGGSTSYTAVYSGFAILLLFMIWLYLGWMILLIGASIAYYHQHPQSLRWSSDDPTLSAALRENLALQLMLEIARAHHHSTLEDSNIDHLAERLRIPATLVQGMLDRLVECDLVVQARQKDGAYVPAHASDTIRLIDILQCARYAYDNGLSRHLATTESVGRFHSEWQACIEQQLGERNLRDLIKQETDSL